MRLNRLYERTAEFRSRCKAFDFAVVAQTVVDIALETRAALLKWKKAFMKNFRMPRFEKKPHQLVLELDAIAQMPLRLVRTA